MANEITLNYSNQMVNGGTKDQLISGAIKVNQGAVGLNTQIVAVPTTAGGTVISFAGITTYGILHITNLDGTNFVTFGPTSGGAMIPLGKVKPGETFPVRLAPGITLRILADTAAVNVQLKIWND